ncbi:MAG: hypothetical protein ACTSXK_09160 [Promethearchaeota archaeon]
MNYDKAHLYDFKNFYKYPLVLQIKEKEGIIAEIAGKDSIAAILNAKDRENFSNSILGIGIFHRSFYGNINEPIEHFQFIQKKYKLQENITINEDLLPFLYLDVANLYDKLILQTMAVVQKHYGLFSPCPPCHLFFHMMRLPIARYYNISRYITGERKTHGSRLKFNQLPEILRLFEELLLQEGIELIQSIKDIKSDQKIYDILGSSWKSADPFKCAFSGNYYDENGEIPFKIKNIIRALKNFYYPLFHEVVIYIEKYHDEPNNEWIKQKIREIL